MFVYVAAAAQQRKRDKHAREVHALHAGSLTAGADAAGTSVEAHVGRATRDKHDAMEDASYGLMSGSLDTHPLRQLRAYACAWPFSKPSCSPFVLSLRFYGAFTRRAPRAA